MKVLTTTIMHETESDARPQLIGVDQVEEEGEMTSSTAGAVRVTDVADQQVQIIHRNQLEMDGVDEGLLLPRTITDCLRF